MRVEKNKTTITQVKVEGEETVEEMLQYGKLCERVICIFFFLLFLSFNCLGDQQFLIVVFHHLTLKVIYYADKAWTSSSGTTTNVTNMSSELGSNDSLVNMEEDL